MKQFVTLPVTLAAGFVIIVGSGAVGKAEIPSVQSVCGTLYVSGNKGSRSLLGERRDTQLGPAVDRFLQWYASRLADTPSYEAFVDRLERNKWDPRIDRCEAYKMLQILTRSAIEDELSRVVDIFPRIEQLLNGHGLAYVTCVRAHLVEMIESLPEGSNLHYTKADVLAQLKNGWVN